MIKTFKFFLFIISFLPTFFFSFKISKEFFKISGTLQLILSSLIINFGLLLTLANLLLFFKIYNLFFFLLFTVPFIFFYFKIFKDIEIPKIKLNMSFIFKTLLIIFIFILVFNFFEALITPPLSWDSLNYHMLLGSLKVQEGKFANLPFDGILSTFNYYSQNYEIFLSIFLLFFNSDFLSNICNFYFLLIIFFATLLLLKEFNFSEKRIFLFLINFLTIPAFFVYIPTQYVEIAGLSLVTSGFAFIKIYEKEKNPYFLILSSLSFVLAISIKNYYILPYVIGNFFIFYIIFKDKKAKPIFLIILLIINLCFSFHYIRMIYKYKNPFYPYPLKIFKLKIGETHPEIIKFIKAIKEKEEKRFERAAKDLSEFEKKIAPYLYTIFTMFSQNHQALGKPALLYSFLGIFGIIFFKNKFWKLFFTFQIFLFIFQFFNPELELLRIMFSLSYSRVFLFPVYIFLFFSLSILEKFKIYEIIFILGFFTNIFLILPEIFLPIHFYLFIISALFASLIFIFFFKYPKKFIIIFLILLIISSSLINFIKEKYRLYFYLNYYHVLKISTEVFPISTFLNGKKTKIHCHFKDDYFSPIPILPYPLIGKNFENKILLINPEGLNFLEWFEKLKKENIEYIVLKGADLIEYKWCLENPDYFKLIYKKEDIVLHTLVR